MSTTPNPITGYVPAATEAVYTGWGPVDPLLLSTPTQATEVLAILEATSGFASGSIVGPALITQNGAADGNAFVPNGETRQVLQILAGGQNGVPLNVGKLLYAMGGLGADGMFTCAAPLGSPTSPIWIPAASSSATPPPVVTQPAGYVWREVIPGVYGWAPPAPAETTGSTTIVGGLTTAQAASLAHIEAILVRVFGA